MASENKSTMPDRLRSTFAAWGLKTLGDEAAEEIERLRDALDDQVRLMRLARLDGIRWVLGDVSKHDLEMLAEDQRGERAAPGPDKRLVEMIKRLMRYAHNEQSLHCQPSPDFVVNAGKS